MAKRSETVVFMLFSNLAIHVVLAWTLATLGGCSSLKMQGRLDVTTASIAPADQRPSDEPIKAGREHFARSDYGLAEKKFRAVAEVNPSSVGAWIGLAASYDRLRRFDLAEKAYEQVLKHGCRTAPILNNLGYHYRLMGNKKKANEYLQEAAQGDPGNPYIRGNLKLVETWTNGPDVD